MKKVYLGHSRKVHGIKGAFTFFLENPDTVLHDGQKIWLEPADDNSAVVKEGSFFTIQKLSLGNKVICTLKEVQDRNKAEELLPFKIYIDRSEMPELDDDEFYLNDLIGMDAINSEGKRVGKVLRFYSNGAQDIVVIRTHNDVVELPLIEQFFPLIDLENNCVTVNFPEYES